MLTEHLMQKEKGDLSQDAGKSLGRWAEQACTLPTGHRVHTACQIFLPQAGPQAGLVQELLGGGEPSVTLASIT